MLPNVQILGGLLSDSVGPARLADLLDPKKEFVHARNRLVGEYRANPAASGAIDSLRDVCKAAEEILGPDLAGAEVTAVVDRNLQKLADPSAPGSPPILMPDSAALDARDGFIQVRSELVAGVNRRATVSVLFRKEMIKGVREIFDRLRSP